MVRRQAIPASATRAISSLWLVPKLYIPRTIKSILLGPHKKVEKKEGILSICVFKHIFWGQSRLNLRGLEIYNFDSCIEKDAEIKAGAAAAAREPLVWSWLGHVVTYFSRAAAAPCPPAACATVPPSARPCCCCRRMRALVLMDPNFLLPPPTLVLPTAIYYMPTIY